MNGSAVSFTETHLKDHTSTTLSTGLGNTRVVFGRSNNALVVRQVNSYYPFGMNIKGLTSLSVKDSKAYSPNEYLYNGKMFQDELGLDLLDYGARMYDAVLGRWHVVDPMYDRHYNYSPYVYVLNNPLLNIDLYGYTDWPTVIKGSAVFVGGLGATIGGAAACFTPTGVGQIGGAALITTGVPAMGLGIGQIVDGIVNDGTTNLPSGVGETVGMGVDAAIGDGSNTFETIGSVTDIAVSLVGGAPATAVEQVALGVQVVSTANDIIGTNDNNSNQITESTTTETKAVSDNTRISTNAPVINVDLNNVKIDEEFVNEYFEVK